MSEALRFNSDKPMMSYFMRSFPKMAEAVARVKEMGAIKYDDGNWKLGNKPDKEYWDSLFRHLNYIFDGEDYDKDTGCLHIAHAVWNLCALLELNYPDLPARDEAIWADRAVHWAEEKRKREGPDEVPQFQDAFVANMLERERERKAAAADEVPQPGFIEEPKFVIPDGFSPVFSQFVRKMATRDHEVRSQYAAHCAEEKRKANDAVDAAVYAAFAAQDLLGLNSHVDECPMCGATDVGQGDYGRECHDCGEIFEVPIVPENPVNALSPKRFSFVIRESDRCQLFSDLVAEYFTPLWRV